MSKADGNLVPGDRVRVALARCKGRSTEVLVKVRAANADEGWFDLGKARQLVYGLFCFF